MDELYLENIDEYVTDQNKIVTYKWLSYTLGVHVNQAKQMLYDYVERKRKENSGVQLHVTYLVTGKHVQNGYPYHKVTVVKEEKLEAVKSKLAVISSVHVYSIQKAVLKDSGPLFNTDYDIIKANLEICNKFSAIQCSFAVRRAPAEIAKSQKSSQPSNEQQVTSAPITNGHGPPPSKAASQPTKGIMGMFAAKGNSKPQTVGKDSKPEVKEAPAATVSSKSTAKSNMVNNFFGKASMKKKASSDLEQMVKEEKSTPQLVSQEPETEVCMSSTVDRPVGKVEEEPAEQPVEIPLSRAAPAMPQKKGKKSKVKRSDVSDSDDEKTTKKKRRRIKKPVSESSEDEDAPASPVAMEEHLQSPSPPEAAVKAEPESQPAEAQTIGKKRKRRRVLKSHTFMDEEGCIVTEKRYETESCTDSENESAKLKPAAPKQSAPPAAKQEPKASKKGAAASSKGVKQASIMGFFQKK